MNTVVESYEIDLCETLCWGCLLFHQSSGLVSHLLIRGFDLLLLLPLLLLQLPRICDAEAVVEDLTNVLEGHALDLGVAPPDCDPAAEADGRVEAKCSGWRCVLHLGEEGAGDDDVGTPTR